MYKLILLLIIGMLASCGGNSDTSAEPVNPASKPSVPNERRKPMIDTPIPYFTEAGHQIRIVKQFEFAGTSDLFRLLTFHYGKRLQANENMGDGRGCKILQPITITDMGPILVQSLSNVMPIGRDVLGSELPDDFQFYGIKFDFTVVGSGLLYCYRHESLGPVTFDDFLSHFSGSLEFL